jgi:hypothetical protein
LKLDSGTRYQDCPPRQKQKGGKLSPSAQSGSLMGKCKTDLARWMGKPYRDITLRCLNAENEDEG